MSCPKRTCSRCAPRSARRILGSRSTLPDQRLSPQATVRLTQISTHGEFNSPRGCRGTFGSVGTAEATPDRGGLHRNGLSACDVHWPSRANEGVAPSAVAASTESLLDALLNSSKISTTSDRHSGLIWGRIGVAACSGHTSRYSLLKFVSFLDGSTQSVHVYRTSLED